MVFIEGFSVNQSSTRIVDRRRHNFKTLEMEKKAREKGEEKKGFCATITIDIKNDFNSLRCAGSLTQEDVSEYLRNSIEDYLHQWQLLHEGEGWFIRKTMTRGVPQGSRLGLFFWKMV